MGILQFLHNLGDGTANLDGVGRDDLVISIDGQGLWARMLDAAGRVREYIKLHDSSPEFVVMADTDGDGLDGVLAYIE